MQHYESEHWAPGRNQTPSWYDWKNVESDVKPEQTTIIIVKLAKTFLQHFLDFGEKFRSKVWVFLYVLYIKISPSAQNRKWARWGKLFPPDHPLGWTLFLENPTRISFQLKLCELALDVAIKVEFQISVVLFLSVSAITVWAMAWENLSSEVCDQVNPHLPNGLSHPYQLDESVFHLRGIWCTFFIFIIFFIEIPVSKQCRPWECGIWSGSALFAYVPKMGCQAFMGYDAEWPTQTS